MTIQFVWVRNEVVPTPSPRVVVTTAVTRVGTTSLCAVLLFGSMQAMQAPVCEESTHAESAHTESTHSESTHAEYIVCFQYCPSCGRPNAEKWIRFGVETSLCDIICFLEELVAVECKILAVFENDVEFTGFLGPFRFQRGRFQPFLELDRYSFEVD